jgi:hypothetical protein
MWAEGLNAKDIHKEIFPVCGGVCRVKRFTRESRNFLTDDRRAQMMPDQIRKWLRQQSKDFYAAGFDALVKSWDKCINVGGGSVQKSTIFPGSNITCFMFISIYDLFIDWPTYHIIEPARAAGSALDYIREVLGSNIYGTSVMIAEVSRFFSPSCELSE